MVRRVTEHPPTPKLLDTAIIDRHRWTIFPNRIREWRRRSGFPKLLALSQHIPAIPYIRLSKIERGEVVARAEELVAIARALGVKPGQLLVDIDDPGFDIARWASEFQDPAAFDVAEDSFAVLLAAALRARRDADAGLSIAAIETVYGIPPVILSRLENAYKTLDRWNDATLIALCRIFGVHDIKALRAAVTDAHESGTLAPYLAQIANPELRIAKTRAKVAALRTELDAVAGKPSAVTEHQTAKGPPPRRTPEAAPHSTAAQQPSAVMAAIQASDTATVRLLPVFGTPLNDGLIARTATGATVEAPRIAGANAFGLRVCRPSLGPALPGRATVIVDPDRFPSAGGIAVIREEGGLRLLSITFDRDGRMMGHSLNPDREMVMDSLDPVNVATVIGAVFE
ncbi:XRE family transcriptional regulator [Sphingomonas cavernae]|uniref:XRE family transcriptional regulator n=1 Tax=Sphingomonas cavernae TaxID=2320861 RepID=A0A418W851_9SPHN|nr:XRE family transcriptional regulator [Sphingomonas cavernae]